MDMVVNGVNLEDRSKAWPQVTNEENITGLVVPLLEEMVCIPLGFSVVGGSTGLVANTDLHATIRTPCGTRSKKRYTVPVETKTWWKFDIPQRLQVGVAKKNGKASASAAPCLNPLVSLWNSAIAAGEKRALLEDKVYHTLRQVCGKLVHCTHISSGGF